jgi:hypothetical protein
MIFTPENFQIIQAHEPVHSNALTTDINAVNLKYAQGVTVIIHEHAVNDANEITYTVYEGETAAEAEAATHVLTAESGSTRGQAFQIWSNLKCQTNDVMVRRTDAVSYVQPGYTAGDDIIIVFYIPASVLTSGRTWVRILSSGGDAGNFISMLYVLSGLRYQQTTVPEATS